VFTVLTYRLAVEFGLGLGSFLRILHGHETEATRAAALVGHEGVGHLTEHGEIVLEVTSTDRPRQVANEHLRLGVGSLISHGVFERMSSLWNGGNMSSRWLSPAGRSEQHPARNHNLTLSLYNKRTTAA